MALNSSLETVLVFMVSKFSSSWAMAWWWEVTALCSWASISRAAVSLGDLGGSFLGIFSAHSAAVWEKEGG